MEVILIEQLKNLGKVGDVVKVKNGFARNFLIPYNKALRATKDNIAYFETQKAEIEKKNKELAKSSEKVAGTIEGTVISVIRQASEDGRLYGSVNARDIVNSLNDSGNDKVERRQVVLSEPIKYIGVYDVSIDLHAEVSATIHVNVARSEDEAAANAEKFKRGEVVMEGKAAVAENDYSDAEAVNESDEDSEKTVSADGDEVAENDQTEDTTAEEIEADKEAK